MHHGNEKTVVLTINMHHDCENKVFLIINMRHDCGNTTFLNVNIMMMVNQSKKNNNQICVCLCV